MAIDTRLEELNETDSRRELAPRVVLETSRDSDAFARLSDRLFQMRDLFLDGYMPLLLATLRPVGRPNQLWLRRGLWANLARAGLAEESFRDAGVEEWLQPSRRDQFGALYGMASVTEESVPAILQRIAGGSQDVLVLGDPGSVHDRNLVQRLHALAFPPDRVGPDWVDLTHMAGKSGLAVVQPLGAFDDPTSMLLIGFPDRASGAIIEEIRGCL